MNRAARRKQSLTVAAEQLTGNDDFWKHCFEFVGPGRYLQASLCTTASYNYAAMYGTTSFVNLVLPSTKLLKFAQAQGYHLSSKICDVAARACDLATLKRMTRLCKCLHSAGNAAARGGQLINLRWLRRKGFDWEPDCFEHACFSGSEEMLDYLWQSRCPRPYYESGIYVQAVLADSEVPLTWLHLHQVESPNYASMCDIAAAGGHVKVLRWLQERGHELTDSVCTIAAQHGQLAVLEFALNLKLPGLKVCTTAAEHNQLAALMYARQRGLAWDAQVCKIAAEKGHFSIMAYAHENGCPWGSNYLSNVSA
jgi:hypothetical protein